MSNQCPRIKITYLREGNIEPYSSKRVITQQADLQPT